MPKAENANNNAALRQLKKQVAELKQQLRASQQEVQQWQAEQERALQEAADIGYEMGYLDAEEREIYRAEVVAEAIAEFEQAYVRQAPRPVVAKTTRRRTTKKPSRGRRVERAASKKV